MCFALIMWKYSNTDVVSFLTHIQYICMYYLLSQSLDFTGTQEYTHIDIGENGEEYGFQ